MNEEGDHTSRLWNNIDGIDKSVHETGNSCHTDQNFRKHWAGISQNIEQAH